MKLSPRRSAHIALNLLAVFAISSNSWLYATPNGWAQAEAPQTNERTDGTTAQPTTLDPAVAKELLEQLYISAESLQDNSHKVGVLVSLANSYSQLSDDARATELMFEAIEIANQTPSEPHLSNSTLISAEIISNDAVAYDLFIRSLAGIHTVENEYLKARRLLNIAFYATERFSDSADHLTDDLMHQVHLAITELPMGDAKAEVLFLLARLYHQQQKDPLALDLLHQSLDALTVVADDDDSKIDLLFQLLDVAEQLPDDVIGEDTSFDDSLLAHVLDVADTVQVEIYRAYIWSDSISLAERSVRSKVPELLQQSLQAFNMQTQIEHNDTIAPVSLLFLSIASSYGSLAEE